MIVGRMSEEKLAEVLKKKVAEQEAAEQILAQGKGSLAVPPKGAEQLSEVADRLRKEREEATKTALRRRQVNGRWVSREAQAEAIATADTLEKLGF